MYLILQGSENASSCISLWIATDINCANHQTQTASGLDSGAWCYCIRAWSYSNKPRRLQDWTAGREVTLTVFTAQDEERKHPQDPPKSSWEHQHSIKRASTWKIPWEIKQNENKTRTTKRTKKQEKIEVVGLSRKSEEQEETDKCRHRWGQHEKGSESSLN